MIKFEQLVEAIHDATTIANSTMIENHHGLLDDYFDDKEGKKIAKSVTISYPVVGKNNEIKSVDVEVPLITLVPISSAQIEELKFSTDLEIALENDDLVVSFAKSQSEKNDDNKWFKKNKGTTAHLDITVKPAEASEGLSKIIEGYEKVLRAQIPS